MKVHVKSISAEGTDFSDTFDLEDDSLTKEGDIHFKSPFTVEGKARRFSNTVNIDVKVKGQYKSFCYRCLEEVEQDWNRQFSLDFSVERNTEYVELDEDIRQEIILNVPLQVLCDEGCHGLCSKCGVNLNEKQCECKIRSKHGTSKTPTFSPKTT